MLLSLTTIRELPPKVPSFYEVMEFCFRQVTEMFYYLYFAKVYSKQPLKCLDELRYEELKGLAPEHIKGICTLLRLSSILLCVHVVSLSKIIQAIADLASINIVNKIRKHTFLALISVS